MRFVSLFAAALLATVPLSGGGGALTAAAQNTQLSIERVFASPSLSGAVPRGVKLSPDGRWLTVLRNRPDDRERYDLWGYDRTAKTWRMLVDSAALSGGRELSEAEKMQRERQRIGDLKGVVTYTWRDDSGAILVPLDGELFLVTLDGRSEKLGGGGGRFAQPGAQPQGPVCLVRARSAAMDGQGGGTGPADHASRKCRDGPLGRG